MSWICEAEIAYKGNLKTVQAELSQNTQLTKEQQSLVFAYYKEHLNVKSRLNTFKSGLINLAAKWTIQSINNLFNGWHFRYIRSTRFDTERSYKAYFRFINQFIKDINGSLNDDNSVTLPKCMANMQILELMDNTIASVGSSKLNCISRLFLSDKAEKVAELNKARDAFVEAVKTNGNVGLAITNFSAQ